jgi:hypothetical protein
MGRVDQEDEDGLDAQDKILKAMAERKMRENASYFLCIYSARKSQPYLKV